MNPKLQRDMPYPGFLHSMNTIFQTALIDAVYDDGQREVAGTTTRAQDILPAEYESKRTRCTVTTARRWDSFKTKMRMRFLQAPSAFQKKVPCWMIWRRFSKVTKKPQQSKQPFLPSEKMDTSDISTTPLTVQPKKKELRQPSFRKRGRTKRGWVFLEDGTFSSLRNLEPLVG